MFFDNIYINILEIIEDTDIDIFYMPENYFSPKFMINGGFFVFRCCPEVLAFLDNVQNTTRKSKIKNDQIVIQNLFQTSAYSIKYDTLRPDIFCTNNNPKRIAENLLTSCKVFHATSATNLIEKCQVLSTFCLKKQLIYNESLLENKNLWIPA
jgi:hypothetical protein